MNIQNHAKITTKEGVLRALVDEISIPEHLDGRARQRYRSIGDWLNRDNSTIKHFEPAISSQGSFMLGTVIRPIGDKDAYDVDVVCNLRRSDKKQMSQAELKAAVGFEITAYAKAKNMNQMPTDGRRCWTMEYADEANFHVDVLPGIPGEIDFRTAMILSGRVSAETTNQFAQTALGITDKKRPDYHDRGADWLISNPRGYGRWFRRRQAAILETHRQKIVARGRVTASVEDVPNHEFRTPLQDAIKLMKRHRDVMFDGDKDKPISVIISTLAAHAYGGQQTLVDTLKAILPAMHRFIEERDGVAWVANPSYPLENFADKWTEAPRKAEKFRVWLRQVNRDFGTYLQASRYDQLPPELAQRMTETTMSKVRPRVSMATPAIAVAAAQAAQAEADKVLAEEKATKPWLP